MAKLKEITEEQAKFTTKELKECFALDNLQPLPKCKNLAKGSKYNG